MSARAARSFIIGAGRLIAEQLYGGDTSAWRTRGPKEHSLRRLAARPSLGVSPTTLYRALSAYELLARSGSLDRWHDLTISHLRSVSGLPFGDQTALLDRAEREQWSVVRLSGEVGSIRRKLSRPQQKGRSSAKPKWQRTLVILRGDLLSDSSMTSDTSRAELLSALQEIQALYTTVRARLEAAGASPRGNTNAQTSCDAAASRDVTIGLP